MASDSTLQSSSHASTSYPSGGLRLVTIGQDVSSSLSELWKRFLDHDHSSSNSMPTYPVDHAQIVNTFHPGPSAPYIGPSGLNSDWHPQYLHRKGLQASRDYYSGGMLGDLYFCATEANYNNLAFDSFGIRWGHTTLGPYLYYDNSDDKLRLENKGLRLSTSGSIYQQGSQNHSIWVDLFTSATGQNWTFEDNGVVPGVPGYYIAGVGASDILFEISDWPEYMNIDEFEIDWDGDGKTIWAYFYTVSWATGSPPSNSVTMITNFYGPPDYATSTGTAREITTYTTWAGASALTHATHKVYLRVVAHTNGGAKIHGLRLTGTYTSVNKWTPIT